MPAMHDSLVFPCGRRIPNRLVKAAMYEGMAGFGGGPPTDQHLNLYSHWASGGWGMIITGNVQVSRSHLTLGRDVTLPQNTIEFDHFRSWARSMNQGSGESKPITIMQLSHAGRQSPRFIGGRHPWLPPLAASANPMVPSESMLARLVFSLLFQSPCAMTAQDIDSVVAAFLEGAKLACQAGFDGVQLHASHGYLLSQFLSVRNNHRSDKYGPPEELRLLRQIVEVIRTEPDIPSTFVVGVKLNAADYAKDRLDEAQALSHVRSISEWGNVDFLEISGGDYESPEFLAKDNTRQAFFSTFSRKALRCLSRVGDHRPLILLTGSVVSRIHISDA
ncbi:hypothetical protein FRC08_000589 [Ceratobasidium sp. 394]|nr:hypothetical protein FRC08_000589 [Ceratobasidium sp. 394]